MDGDEGRLPLDIDKQPDGRFRAQASGPIVSGPAASIGVAATKYAATKNEAERLLLDELKRMKA